MQEVTSAASPAAPGPDSVEARARAELLQALMPALLHRLNNSAAVVLGMSELLLSGELSPEQRQRLGFVHQQAGASCELLRRLGDYSLGMRDGPGAVDLGDLLARALGLLQPLARDGASVELDTSAPLRVVRGDPNQLLGMLVLLLAQAMPCLHERPDQGQERLRVALRNTGRWVVLSLAVHSPSGRLRISERAIDSAAAAVRAHGGRMAVRAGHVRRWGVQVLLPAFSGS